MALMRGVMPIAFGSRGLASRHAARTTVKLLFARGLLAADDRVIFTCGDTMEQQGATNTLRLLEVGADGWAVGLGKLRWRVLRGMRADATRGVAARLAEALVGRRAARRGRARGVRILRPARPSKCFS